MDLSSHSIHLHRAVHEICLCFMQIFKDDEIPSLPEFISLNEFYPSEQKFKIISFLISAAIDVFNSLPHKIIQSLIGNKIGLWRTLVVRLCILNGADIHHLPLEIDIIASRNKLVLDSIIFNWPFCNNTVSDLLEYFCDSFHGSNNVSQPYIDEYAFQFKLSHKRTETIKCITLCIKWVHAIQGSPSYSYTKEVLKNSVMNLIVVSDIVMGNRDGQFEEVWKEICEQLYRFDEFESTRIDSYPLYCSLNPLLKTFSDFIRSLLVDNCESDFTKIINRFPELSAKYESRQIWKSELTNTMLTALNTVMTENLFRKCKSIRKITEINLKIFVNAVADDDSLSQRILMSEVTYWIERLKRKKIELPLQLRDFFNGIWSKTTKESTFKSNLEHYFLKVLENDPCISDAPALCGSNKIISDGKLFQKIILDCLTRATDSLQKLEPHTPPILESKIKMIFTIIERMAEHYYIRLGCHFYDKIVRIVEKFNDMVLLPSPNSIDSDDKNLIIPLMDNFDFKSFVTFIWQFVDLSNPFVRPMNIQEYLIDLRHELFSKIDVNIGDRIISRIVFFVGWRFQFRAKELLSDELFRFHLIFNFLGENLPQKPLLQQSLRLCVQLLSTFNIAKDNVKNTEVIPFQTDDFYKCTKIDSVKNHLLKIFRGTKHLPMVHLSDVNIHKSKRGLESTKSILLILRQLFGKLNEKDRHKNDRAKYWLKNSKAVETELFIICCKLDADINQVLGELNYLVNIIRVSIHGDSSIKKKELVKKEECISPTLINDTLLKKENSLIYDNQALKRNNQASPNEDELERPMKLVKLNETDSDLVDSKEAVMSLMRGTIKKQTIFSKVNFIDQSERMATGETIESRIMHVNEPSSTSICVDVKKDKLRPAKYVQIASRPNQNSKTIFKKPRLCSKRNMAKSPYSNVSGLFCNFKIIRQIGQGVFGKVFEAVDTLSNIRLALKNTTLDNFTEGVPLSILREIFLYRTNNHCNIIQFFGIVVNEIEAIKTQYCDSEIIIPKSFYFVFEYMEHDLHGLMKSKSMIFSIGEIGLMAMQLFAALAHLHEQNIVHRDVIPSNIMINNRGVLKLADFGNARFIAKDVNFDTNIVMTPNSVSYIYQAPEILLDYKSYGTEVDIWSAGCVIYEMLTGSKLFSSTISESESKETMLAFLENMAKVLGSPNPSVWPTVKDNKYYVDLATTGIAINYTRKIDDFMTTIPSDVADVLKQIFHWDPKNRPSSKSILSSDWLKNVELQPKHSIEFPDKNCHEYLLDNYDCTEDIFVDMVTETTSVDNEPMESVENVYDMNVQHDDVTMNDDDDNEEPINDEDLKQFVESLSGKILELSDILDRLRQESVYSPEICQGIIMRAAREWSNREKMRLRMVPFMLDYLLKAEEKQKLYV